MSSASSSTNSSTTTTTSNADSSGAAALVRAIANDERHKASDAALKDADKSRHGPEQWTLLHFAAYYGRMWALEALLPVDQEHLPRDALNTTPLEYAACGPHECTGDSVGACAHREAIELLLKRCIVESALVRAALRKAADAQHKAAFAVLGRHATVRDVDDALDQCSIGKAEKVTLRALFDPFEVRHRGKLGAGKYGEVWKAQARVRSGHTDNSGWCDAVVKMPHRSSTEADASQARDDLRREIAVLECALKLPDSALRYFVDVVHCYQNACWTDGGELAFGDEPAALLGYCAEGSVNHFLADWENLPTAARIRGVGHVLRALDILHSKNFLHLDVCAENVLLERTNTDKQAWFRLTDFGKSCRINEKPQYNLRGAPFTAPELENADLNSRGEATRWSDFWSWAALVLQVLLPEEFESGTVMATLIDKVRANEKELWYDVLDEPPSNDVVADQWEAIFDVLEAATTQRDDHANKVKYANSFGTAATLLEDFADDYGTCGRKPKLPIDNLPVLRRSGLNIDK